MLRAFVTKFDGSEMTTLPLTNLTLTENADPQTVGLSVTITAQVTPASRNAVATGSVFFASDPRIVELRITAEQAFARHQGALLRRELRRIEDYHNTAVRNARVRRLQCDENWCFVGAKAKNVTVEKKAQGWATFGPGRPSRPTPNFACPTWEAVAVRSGRTIS
jgi:hypothetical protein